MKNEAANVHSNDPNPAALTSYNCSQQAPSLSSHSYIHEYRYDTTEINLEVDIRHSTNVFDSSSMESEDLQHSLSCCVLYKETLQEILSVS